MESLISETGFFISRLEADVVSCKSVVSFMAFYDLTNKMLLRRCLSRHCFRKSSESVIVLYL